MPLEGGNGIQTAGGVVLGEDLDVALPVEVDEAHKQPHNQSQEAEMRESTLQGMWQAHARLVRCLGSENHHHLRGSGAPLGASCDLPEAIGAWGAGGDPTRNWATRSPRRAGARAAGLAPTGLSVEETWSSVVKKKDLPVRILAAESALFLGNAGRAGRAQVGNPML